MANSSALSPILGGPVTQTPGTKSATASKVKSASRGAGSAVPANQSMLTHLLILLLIDISLSMGEGPDPDIVAVQRMAQNLIDDLAANPTPGVVVEVAIMAYNHEMKLVQEWAPVSQITVPTLTASGSTSTGLALLSATDYVERRKDYFINYPGMPIPFAAPHIVHLTDGAPNDVRPGDDLWNDVRAQIAGFSPQPEKDPYQCVSHFVAQNGLVPGQTGLSNQQGQAVSGKEMLTQWTGGDTVFELVDAPAKYASLGRIIAQSVKSYTRKAATIHETLKKNGGQTIRNAGSSSSSSKKGE